MKKREGTKKEENQPTITFYVAECAEFPDMGRIYENLSLEDAYATFETMTSRTYGPKSIGFDLHDGSDYEGKFDLMVGNELQTDIINGISHYRASKLVQKAIVDLEQILIESGLMDESSLSPKTIIPIYRLSFDEAIERGETEQWKANHWETKACALEFSHNFQEPDFVSQMVDKYGLERCKIVLASTIQLDIDDGRYYPNTKEAASKVFIPNMDPEDKMNDRRFDYRTECHPVKVDSAFQELLKIEKSLEEHS